MTDDLLDFDPDAMESIDDEDDENYVRVKKTDFVKARKAARKGQDARRTLADLQRQEQVRAAGLDGLSDRQIAVLASQAGDNPTSETLRELAVEFKWVEAPEPSEEQQQTDAEIDAHTQAAAVATGAEPPAQRTAIPAEAVAGWPVDKQMRLEADHPDIYERTLRGEPITLPPGFN
jgi:hypothetical protein